jgi:redox-sensitive bicupin YhaK (pirin superfamily)
MKPCSRQGSWGGRGEMEPNANTGAKRKAMIEIVQPPPGHWVGDGFPVRSLFSYSSHAQTMSPFLMLDVAGPATFAPAERPRGVGPHPHRGFETVTIVFAGEVSHRDSTGEGGSIGPGDVQWMTAASGILHQEFHSERFTREGGVLEMMQLWVNLPARSKMEPPAYQAIPASRIPTIDLPGGAGTARVIAGEFAGRAGPARTHTPMYVWDLRLNAGAELDLPAPQGWNCGVVVVRGAILAGAGAQDGEASARAAQMVVFSREGAGARVRALEESSLLYLCGEPIDEPIAGYGPFVMNTQAEIRTAITDFQGGRFGTL